MSRIAELLPAPRLRQTSHLPVAASPEAAWAAARAVDIEQVTFARWLFSLRTAPERAAARLRGRTPPALHRGTIDSIVGPGSGFHLLADEPGEVVVGAIGRFWRPRIEWRAVTPEELAGFAEPGWGMLAWSIRVAPGEIGSYAGRRSAETIIPELQDLQVGAVLPALPGADSGFTVLSLEPRRSLVLGSPGLLPGGATDPRVRPDYLTTWSFVLTPVGDDATELNVRARLDDEPTARAAVRRTVLGAVHGIMERAQLRNLKRRAEARPG